MKLYLACEVQCICCTPYRWTLPRNTRKTRVIFTVLPGTRADPGTASENMHPNLAEPGGESGVQGSLELKNWDYHSMPLQDSMEQSWRDIFPATPFSRTRGLPNSTAPLLLQRVSQLLWRCSEVCRLATCRKTCRRLTIPHVDPVSSLSSTRDILSMHTRYPVYRFEVISLGVV